MSHINQNDPSLTIIDDPRYGRLKELVGIAQISNGGLHSTDISVAVCDVDAGKASPAHWHNLTTEVYYITEGIGRITLDGRTIDVSAGDACLIPVRKVHSVRALEGGLKMLVLTSPAYTTNDDFEIDEHGLPPTEVPRAAIAVIIGTHRPGSASAKIARQIAEMYRELGVTTDVIDPTELPLDIFHPSAYARRYDTDSLLAQRLISADGLVFVTPEYNGSIPGVLKHIMDVQNYEKCFGGKASCLVGVAAGDFGGVRAIDHLTAILLYRNGNIYGRRTLIRNVDEALFDNKGHLSDPEIVERLRAQAAGFAQFVRALAPARARV